MSERPKSLESLLGQRTRLSSVLEQRRRLFNTVGKGEVKATTLANTVRIGHVRERVQTNVGRIESRLSQLQEEITTLVILQEEQLITQAQAYLDEVAISQAHLGTIRDYLNRGLLTEDILSKETIQSFDRDHQELLTRPETDSQLKKGIELLRQGQEQKKEKEKPKPQEQVPVQVEEERVLPLLRISEEKREIKLEGWEEPKKVPGKVAMAVLISLAKNPKQRVSTSVLKEAAIKTGSKDKDPVGIGIYHLRQLIEPDPKNPQIIIRSGSAKQATYSLNTEVMFEDEEKAKAERSQKRKEARQVFEFTLPDGQVVQIMGNYKAKTLEKLLDSFKENRPIETDELVLTLYGVYNRKTYTSTTQFVAGLRKDLQPAGWRIIQPVSPPERAKGKKGAYYLEKVQVEEKPPETIQEVEVTPLGEEEIAVAAISTTAVLTEDIIELPYVPTEEEKRSEEETQILNVVVSLFSANLHNPRIRFDDIISELSPQIQRKSLPAALGGKPLYRIYSAAELKDKFTSAFRKLREEAAITHLKETWTENEKNLWTKIEFAVGRISGENFDDFSRKVRIEIDRSLKQFYREHPPSTGRGPVGWVEG